MLSSRPARDELLEVAYVSTPDLSTCEATLQRAQAVCWASATDHAQAWDLGMVVTFQRTGRLMSHGACTLWRLQMRACCAGGYFGTAGNDPSILLRMKEVRPPHMSCPLLLCVPRVSACTPCQSRHLNTALQLALDVGCRPALTPVDPHTPAAPTAASRVCPAGLCSHAGLLGVARVHVCMSPRTTTL